MAKRAPKRAGRAKTTTTAKPTQPMLPNIVAGALAVGTEVGRAALRAAQDVLGAAGATRRSSRNQFCRAEDTRASGATYRRGFSPSRGPAQCDRRGPASGKPQTAGSECVPDREGPGAPTPAQDSLDRVVQFCSSGRR